MDTENYFKYSEDLYYNDTNEKELKFFAKLALVIIYDDIIFLIVDLFKNKMCENKYNDDIKTFITNNLNKDIIKEIIYNHLLKNDINDYKNIIINECDNNLFDAIQVYKEHFNNNELTELIYLLYSITL